MTKFKVGDRIKTIKGTNILKTNSKYTILKYIRTHPIINNKFNKTNYIDDYFELIKPTGFEVGKKYSTSTSQEVFEVLGISGTYLWYKNIRTGIHVTGLLTSTFVKCLREYIPPPPEEWRIVYKDRFGNVTVGKTPFKSESEAKASRYWTDHSSSFKTIRVDA